MASVTKYEAKSGKKGWRIQVSMPRGEDGKQQVRGRVFYPVGVANPWGREGRSQAERAELEFRDELGRATTAERETFTLAYVIDRYIRSRTEATAKQWSPKTEENTLMWRERIVDYFGAKRTIGSITSGDIGEFLSWLRRHGRQKGEGPLTYATVQRCDDVLRAVFAYAMDEDIIETSPIRRKHRPQREPHEVDPPTKAHVYELRDRLADTPFWQALFVLATTTGARRGELVALKWGDLQPAAFRILIRRNRVAVKGGVVEKLPKAGKVREVSVTSEVFDLLSRFYDHCLAEWDVDRLPDDAYIFATGPGEVPVHPERVRHWWENDGRTRLEGMERHTFHELRHYVGTELTAAGVGFADIAEHLGHASPETSARLYSHARKKVGATAAAELL